MRVLILSSLGLVATVVAAGATWLFRRTTSGPDLGSISRNWMVEHRNDAE
jgi:hypothetical protein